MIETGASCAGGPGRRTEAIAGDENHAFMKQAVDGVEIDRHLRSAQEIFHGNLLEL